MHPHVQHHLSQLRAQDLLAEAAQQRLARQAQPPRPTQPRLWPSLSVRALIRRLRLA